jgi:hypothetical protein
MRSRLGRFYAVDPRARRSCPAIRTRDPRARAASRWKGRDQTYAPDLTFNFGVQREFRYGNDIITPRFNYAHVSEQWATLFQNEARGRSHRGPQHRQRADRLAAWVVPVDAVRNQPHRPALRGGDQLGLAFRRCAAHVWASLRHVLLTGARAACFDANHALTVDKFLDHAAKWSRSGEVVWSEEGDSAGPTRLRRIA